MTSLAEYTLDADRIVAEISRGQFDVGSYRDFTTRVLRMLVAPFHDEEVVTS